MENEEIIVEQEKFVIDTASKADWAVGIIKEERQRRDLFIDVAKEKILTLQQQIKDAETKCDNSTSGLLFALSEYLDVAPAKKTKTRASLSLPSGKLIKKLAKQDYQYEEEKLLEYLKSNASEYVKTVEKSSWGEFKKDLEIADGLIMRKSTGEIVDCISVKDIEATFDVE